MEEIKTELPDEFKRMEIQSNEKETVMTSILEAGKVFNRLDNAELKEKLKKMDDDAINKLVDMIEDKKPKFQAKLKMFYFAKVNYFEKYGYLTPSTSYSHISHLRKKIIDESVVELLSIYEQIMGIYSLMIDYLVEENAYILEDVDKSKEEENVETNHNNNSTEEDADASEGDEGEKEDAESEGVDPEGLLGDSTGV